MTFPERVMNMSCHGMTCLLMTGHGFSQRLLAATMVSSLERGKIAVEFVVVSETRAFW